MSGHDCLNLYDKIIEEIHKNQKATHVILNIPAFNELISCIYLRRNFRTEIENDKTIYGRRILKSRDLKEDFVLGYE